MQIRIREVKKAELKPVSEEMFELELEEQKSGFCSNYKKVFYYLLLNFIEI